MLPFEAHLLAAGWPRWELASDSGEDSMDGDGDGSGSGEGELVMTKEGSRGARMLFQARRWVWACRQARCAFPRMSLLPCTGRHGGSARLLQPRTSPCLLQG